MTPESALQRAREVVGQHQYAGKGYHPTLPFSEHQHEWLAQRFAQALIRAHDAGFQRAVEMAANKCCSIDSSDVSHETAESNAAAIRQLLLVPSQLSEDEK